MNPLISVVIPVYNVEKYIIECLESVKAQTFTDFEAIIVNDGTKDKSAILAQNFIEKNNLSNFRIINKPNGGLSSARNTGLDNAKGKWIYFLDSDDWMEPDALKDLVDCLGNKDVDIVIGGYQAFDQLTGKKEKWNNYPLEYGKFPDDLWAYHSFSFVVSRLYSKQIIDKNNLRFDERIEYAEDNAWQFDYGCCVKSYACTNKVGYNYRINREGALTSSLVTPKMKYYIGEHMMRFYDLLDEDTMYKSLKDNPRLLSVTWGVLSTSVVNDILDKKIKSAKQKMKLPLSRIVTRVFTPRSMKEKIFFLLWKKSFACLKMFVITYYRNFDKLRRTKFMQKMSKRG